MFRYVASFVASLVVLVIFKDWFFKKVPEAQSAWDAVKIKIATVYQVQGWEGIILLAVVVVAAMKMIEK